MNRHKSKSQAFTRKRFFKFEIVCVMLLQKTLKSIQLHLHALTHQLELLGGKAINSVSSGAWTRARAKLKHTAFIELNEAVILKEFYRSNLVRRFKGYRLLGIDGSVVALPPSQAIFEQFGQETSSNQNADCSKTYAQAQCSVLYDLLNQLSLKACFEPYRTSEVSQAQKLCESLKPKDIVLADRGYASAPFMSCVIAQGADFIVRLPRNSFKQSQALFTAKKAGKSIVTEVVVQDNTIGRPKGEVIRVRFISVDIPGTGEREVIATSLLDEKAFPSKLFAEIYNQRWGIETYYHQLKNRLDLENFSGRSVESVYQDFYAMLFISNYETMLTGPARRELEQAKPNNKAKADLLPKAINHSVSYHLIKEHALELFFSSLPQDILVSKLTELFQMNPHSMRNRGPTPQNNTSTKTSARFRKQIRKITF